jgi:formyltetrahydrofolate-dependent phosphoribosylglycinamide formyltransferase
MKIANDVRWLASGPRCGIGEITIPGERAGQLDHAGQGQPDPVRGDDHGVRQVMGNDVAVGVAGASGNFELNVFKPLIATTSCRALRLLGDGCASFEEHCAAASSPTGRASASNLERSLMLVTALNPHIGYDKAAQDREEGRYPTREAFDAALAGEIDRHAPHLVALAGFMRVLTPAFVARYADRLINIHPSLLPAFPGLDTHARALAAGATTHGCTVHFVTEQLDHGPIIAQASVPVLPDDTPESLAARVLAEEHVLYPRAIRWFLDGRLVVEGERVHVKGNNDEPMAAGDRA